MSSEENVGKRRRRICERSAAATGLPKYACFLGRRPRTAPTDFSAPPGCDFYEFEVVRANAAYHQGERFYLTPTQAERAYFSGRRTP